jgi:hypothetical protein
MLEFSLAQLSENGVCLTRTPTPPPRGTPSTLDTFSAARMTWKVQAASKLSKDQIVVTPAADATPGAGKTTATLEFVVVIDGVVSNGSSGTPVDVRAAKAILLLATGMRVASRT